MGFLAIRFADRLRLRGICRMVMVEVANLFAARAAIATLSSDLDCDGRSQRTSMD